MKNKKVVLWCALAAVVVALLVGGFARMTDGFRNWDTDEWFESERNPENLLKLTCYNEERIYETDGLKIEINADGSVIFAQSEEAVDGKPMLFEFAKATLAAGTYTYTGSPDGTSTTYKLIADYPLDESDTIIRVNADNDGECIFTLSKTTEVSFALYIADEYVTTGTTVYPTLSAGDEAIDFYLD